MDENYDDFPFDIAKKEIPAPLAIQPLTTHNADESHEKSQINSTSSDVAHQGTKEHKMSPQKIKEFADFLMSLDLDNPQKIANQIGEFATTAEASALAVGFVSLSVPAKSSWPEPQPLPDPAIRAPTMTPDLVPAPLRDLITLQAQLACLPLEMLAVPTIGMFSGLIGRTILITPDPMNPTWQVVPNLWSMIVAPPGMLKTPVLQMALNPLRILEEEVAEKHAQEFPNNKRRLDNVRAQLSKIGIGSQALDVKFSQLKAEETALELNLQPKRYLIVSATTQKIGRILMRNQRGVVLWSDELAQLLRPLDLGTNSEKRELFLKAWSGNDLHAFDTVSSGTVYVRNPCLTIIGAIQPGPLQDHLRRNGAGKAGDQGMLQRFQLAVFPDQLGAWQRSEGALSETDLLRLMSVVRTIDGWWEAQNSVPTKVVFSSEAQKEWYRWHDELEDRLRGSELTAFPALQALLLKYRSLVPSLALVFTALNQASHPTANHNVPQQIELPELSLAISWATFLEAHGWKIFGGVTHPAEQSMRHLAEKIRSHEVEDLMSLRELGRKKWRGLTESHQIQSAVNRLAQLHWLHVEELETSGRPSKVLRLNPQLETALQNWSATNEHH